MDHLFVIKIFKNLSSFYCELYSTLLMVLVALLCERMSQPLNCKCWKPLTSRSSSPLSPPPQNLLLHNFYEKMILELVCEVVCYLVLCTWLIFGTTMISNSNNAAANTVFHYFRGWIASHCVYACFIYPSFSGFLGWFLYLDYCQ